MTKGEHPKSTSSLRSGRDVSRTNSPVTVPDYRTSVGTAAGVAVGAPSPEKTSSGTKISS